MENQIRAAITSQSYKQAYALLKQWQQKNARNPLLRFYAAQLQEKTNRLDAAEKNYKNLLQHSTHRKIVSEARAGIARIHQRQKEEKAAALEQARSVEGAEEKAILAITALPTLLSNTLKKDAVSSFASIFNLDAYTARMKLPTKGFRIYRVGFWGELNYFKQQLSQANIPSFCVKTSDIRAIEVFQVAYFESLTPQATIVCKNAAGQLGKLSFDWHEVKQQIKGQLPIFEKVVDLGPRGRTLHKEQVQDYAQVFDLHLPGRKIVVRLCDRLYQYKKGVSLSQTPELNSRILWNQLLTNLSKAADTCYRDNFNQFSKSASEFINLLPAIPTNLDIDRRAPSEWDIIFHLYSSLCYLQRQT